MSGGITSSKRVSIKDYHLPFLAAVGQQIGTDDLSEIVNYAINQLKLLTKAKQPSHSIRAQQSIAHIDPTAELTGIPGAHGDD